MAAIDHTVIVFKNGEYMKEPRTFNDDGKYINNCPFDYGRDGNIAYILASGCKRIYIYDDIKWHCNEYDAMYERDGIYKIRRFRLSFWTIWEAIKWKLHIMRRVGYKEEVGEWGCGDVEVCIYHSDSQDIYASFYKDSENTYVVLGGYGHYRNPYTHFMSRGYGDEFEEKMAAEAYQWLRRDILREISESLYDDYDEGEEWLSEMRKRF